MKKGLLILFGFLYLASTSGISLNLHYCSGHLKSISFFHTNEADCCGTKMKKKRDCCKEKSFVHNVKVDQQSSTGLHVDDPAKQIVSHLSTPQTLINSLDRVSNALPYLHAPPNLTYSDTYLKNRVFRI